MPPWIMPELAPLAPLARSCFSSSRTERPRMAQSRATPAPFTPPPSTTTSKVPWFAAPAMAAGLLPRLGRALHVQLAELPRVGVAGGPGHQIRPLLRLGPGHHVPERLRAGQQHDQPVHAERDAAVGGGAHPEGIQEEAELAACVLVGDAHGAEDAGLYLGIVET